MSDDRAVRLASEAVAAVMDDNGVLRGQLAEALDEVERLRGLVERLQVEKHDLAERLMRAERQWDAVRK